MKVDRDELQKVVDSLVLNENNKQAAADYCGLKRTTYRDKLVKAGELGIKPSILPPNAEAKVLELTIKYEQEIRDLKKKLKINVEENIGAEIVRESIYGLLDHDPSPPEWVIEEKENITGTPGTPTLFISDIHYGEVVSKTEMEGLNEYNMDIADRRIKHAINKTIDLCFNHMVNPNYPGIVLALGGDMHSGDIHQELAESNEGTSLQGTLRMFDLFIGAIDQLVSHFGKVFIPCAYGNHGRAGIWRNKKSAAYNHDWQLYCLLEHHYNITSPNANVKFSVPMSYDTRYRLHGFDYILTHGDRLGVRGGDGVIGMIGPIARGIKKLKASYAAQNKPVDYIIMGHWHQRLRLKDGMVNGSVKGYDEYAASNRFEPEAAMQSLWWTHPKYGINYECPIFLDEVSEYSNKWIEIFDG